MATIVQMHPPTTISNAEAGDFTRLLPSSKICITPKNHSSKTENTKRSTSKSTSQTHKWPATGFSHNIQVTKLKSCYSWISPTT